MTALHRALLAACVVCAAGQPTAGEPSPAPEYMNASSDAAKASGGASPDRSAARPAEPTSRAPAPSPARPRQDFRLIHQLYWIGVERDLRGADLLIATLAIEDLAYRNSMGSVVIRRAAWFAAGRLEHPALLARLEPILAFELGDVGVYRSTALARLGAAGDVPVVATTAQLAQRVQAFLARLEIRSAEELHQGAHEYLLSRPIMRNSPSTGSLHLIALDNLSDMLADAARRGIDIGPVERQFDFSIRPRTEQRLRLAKLQPAQRIRALVEGDRIGERVMGPDALAVELVRAPELALPAVVRKIEELALLPPDERPGLLTRLISALGRSGHPAARQIIAPFVEDENGRVAMAARNSLRDIEAGHRRVSDPWW